MKQKTTNLPSGLSWKQLEKYALELVLAFAFLLYANTIFNQYSLDDELVTRNHRLTSRGIAALPDIFSSPYYSDEMGYSYGYRPVTLAFFAIEHSLWGDNPHLSHLMNALGYALLCGLLYLVLRRVLKDYPFWVPWFVALGYAAHPTHTEVVASLKNREEILSLLGGLGAIYWLTDDRKSQGLSVVLAVSSFAFGVFSKNSIVLFPVIIPWLFRFLHLNLNPGLLVFTVLATILAAFQLEGQTALGTYWYVLGSGFSVLVVYASAYFQNGNGTILWKNLVQRLNQSPELQQDSNTPVRAIPFSPIQGLMFIGGLLPVALGLFYFFPEGSAYLFPAMGLILLYLFPGTSIGLIALVLFDLSLWKLLQHNTDPALWQHTFDLLLFIHAFATAMVTNRWKWLLPLAVLFFLPLNPVEDQWINNAPALLGLGMFYLIILKKHLRLFKIVLVVILLLQVLNFLTQVDDKTAFRWMYIALEVSWILGGFLLVSTKIQARSLFRYTLLLMPLYWALHLGEAQSADKSNMRFHENRTLDHLRKDAEQLPSLSPAITVNRPLNEIEIPLGYQANPEAVTATGTAIIGKYLILLFKPWPLAFYYGYKEILPLSWSDWEPWWGLACIGMLGMLALWAVWKKEKLIYLGVLWMLISIFPYSNLLLRIPGMFADRYAFIPGIGWALTLVGLLYWANKKWFGKNQFAGTQVWVVFGLILLPMSLLSVYRNTQWKDHLTLLRSDINHIPNSVQAQNLLASHLIIRAGVTGDPMEKRKLQEEALIHFKKAVELYPGFFNTVFDLGRTYYLLEEWDSALICFDRAKVIKSDYAELSTSISLTLSQLGIRAEKNQQLNLAIQWYQKAIEADSLNDKPVNSLAFLYFKNNDFPSAKRILEQGIQHLPGSFDLKANLGKIYLQNQQFDSAKIYFREAYRIRPGDPALTQILQQLGEKGFQ